MRVRVALAVLAVAVPTAHAENFIEVAGGLMSPLSDDQWTDYVDASPKLAARIGASGGGKFGAMVSVDWTPVNTDDFGFGNALDISAQRFRILVGGTTNRRVGNKLDLSFRFGLGLDLTYVSAEGSVFGFQVDSSDGDAGLALEPAAGLWFDAGSVVVGAELALPISVLHDDGDDNDIDLDEYTSVDLDVLFGVRFRQ